LKTELENPPQSSSGLRPRIDFKLLKCLILRFVGDCTDYITKTPVFRPYARRVPSR